MSTKATAATARTETPAKRTAAKKATARRTPRRPAPEKHVTYPVGTTLDLDVDPEATSVVIERPDGSEVAVFAAGGRAVYVLDQAGTHVAGGLAIHAAPLGEEDGPS